jgi:ribosome-binding protein aMBF1 (putative translation factor)
MDKRDKTSDAKRILARITGDDPKLREAVEEQKLNVRVAEMICEAREAAGLTQTDLAKLVGTTQSVISRLEDADYEGRSLTMLQRVADALHHRLEVRLVPAGESDPRIPEVS